MAVTPERTMTRSERIDATYRDANIAYDAAKAAAYIAYRAAYIAYRAAKAAAAKQEGAA